MAPRFLDRLSRIMTQPRDELNRFQRTLRFAYDLGRYGARQLRDGRAPQMAAALSFRVLFALMPVLVVGTVLARALMGQEGFRGFVHDVFTWMGLYDIRINLPATTTDATERLISIGEFLDHLVGQAAQLNLAAVGWLGLAVLIYSAIGLMVTIENSFNAIYRAPQGRSWTRRVPLHWFVLTVGPVAIGLTMYFDKIFDSWLVTVGSSNWLLHFGPVVAGFLATWFFLFAVYTLVPNTHVAMRPALVGSFVAAILLEIGRQTLGAYLGHALSIRQLYGSLGLVPLFMFWIYLMWLVVLFGLQVGAILQMLGGRRLEEIEAERHLTGLVDPTSVLAVMQVVAEQFRNSQPTTARQIADETALSEATVARMLDQLIAAQFLYRLDREDNAVSLSRPPDQISADELIEIGYRLADDGAGERSSIIHRLRDAQRSLARQVTLATLAADQAAGG